LTHYFQLDHDSADFASSTASIDDGPVRSVNRLGNCASCGFSRLHLPGCSSYLNILLILFIFSPKSSINYLE